MDSTARDAFLADAKATASRAGLTVPERQAYVVAEATRYDEEIAGSLVLVLDTPEILAARAAREVARARREELSAATEEAYIARGACPTGKGSRTAALKYSRALTALDDHVQFTLDYANRDVEMAVRAANVGAPERLTQAAARNL